MDDVHRLRNKIVSSLGHLIMNHIMPSPLQFLICG